MGGDLGRECVQERVCFHAYLHAFYLLTAHTNQPAPRLSKQLDTIQTRLMCPKCPFESLMNVLEGAPSTSYIHTLTASLKMEAAHPHYSGATVNTLLALTRMCDLLSTAAPPQRVSCLPPPLRQPRPTSGLIPDAQLTPCTVLTAWS